jgi:16S rRNA (cytosine1402-N4)-methyltransferase
MDTYHVSVLLHETIDALQIKPGKRYIDATVGGGGHTLEIVKRGGVVLGIDTDEDAVQFTGEKSHKNNHITLVQGNFKDIDILAKEHGFEMADGILFDLGVSSHQFDTPERGFSFQNNGPLDMRMGSDMTVRAADLVNGLHAGELTKLFLTYGEEPRAKMIVAAIIKARDEKRIETTRELAEVIERIMGRKVGEIHPATRVFQALRIAVNDELHSLERALVKSTNLLVAGGRLAVITFHSLEDRIVKHVFDTDERMVAKTKKPIMPSEREIQQNRRARSAKLRIFEKN